MKRAIAATAIAVSTSVLTMGVAHAAPGPHGHHAKRPPVRPSVSSPAPVQPAQPNAPGRGFTLDCTHSHSNTVDPIVMPGHAGMSHLHEFFGNTGTNEHSTGSSLLADGTTCNDANNHSSYWIPALYQDGTYIQPKGMKVRYNVAPRGTTTAFPIGFMAVSGRTDTTAAWGCVTPGQKPVMSGAVATVPTCTGQSHLVAQVTFGECWDGTSLDSSNHMSHLVLSSSGRCPTTNPVRVPQVRLTVDYPKSAIGGSGVTLSSGAASTLHGDIFEAWAGDALKQRITSS